MPNDTEGQKAIDELNGVEYDQKVISQTTITILSTVKISISNETDFCNVRPLAGRVCGKRTNH